MKSDLPKEHVDIICFSFFLFFLILVPFNLIDADERNANVDKKKLKKLKCFLCCETTKKVHRRVHVSVISQNLKKLDGSNNRLYAPEINGEE